MQNVLLLTDDASSCLTSRELGIYGLLKFDYLFLNHKVLTYPESTENDFNRILNACSGKDVVILQISGNKAIYLLDLLLRASEFDCNRFVLVQSPLIDFYFRPVEEFYVDRAIRRKLNERSVHLSVIRPILAYFMPFSSAQIPLLSETSVYRQILSDLEQDAGWDKTRYFLPETIAGSQSNSLNGLNLKFNKLSHFLLPFGWLQHTRFYQRLLEEDALCHLLKHINKVPDVLFMKPATDES